MTWSFSFLSLYRFVVVAAIGRWSGAESTALLSLSLFLALLPSSPSAADAVRVRYVVIRGGVCRYVRESTTVLQYDKCRQRGQKICFPSTVPRLLWGLPIACPPARVTLALSYGNRMMHAVLRMCWLISRKKTKRGYYPTDSSFK